MPRILHFTLFSQREVRKLDGSLYVTPWCYRFLPVGKAGDQFTLFLGKKGGKEGEREQEYFRKLFKFHNFRRTQPKNKIS